MLEVGLLPIFTESMCHCSRFLSITIPSDVYFSLIDLPCLVTQETKKVLLGQVQWTFSLIIHEILIGLN